MPEGGLVNMTVVAMAITGVVGVRVGVGLGVGVGGRSRSSSSSSSSRSSSSTGRFFKYVVAGPHGSGSEV